MKKNNILKVSSLLFLALIFSCKGSGEKAAPRKSSHAPTAAMKLKQGMKIHVAHQNINPNSMPLGKNTLRILTLEDPSSAEGLSFSWRETPDGKEPPIPQGQVITADTTTQDTLPAGNQLPPDARPYFGAQTGKMSLPNMTQARRMTLPIFWPEGDLFLSNSTGIWLSDIAFEEIKGDRKTHWNPGLLNNPLLGPVQGIQPLEKGLAQLQEQLDNKEAEKDKGLSIQSKRGAVLFPIRINGKDQELEVIEAQNWLASYKILNNAQNPLVLQVTVAPEASITEILFSPVGLIKGLAEYKVIAIEGPNYHPDLPQSPEAL